MCGIVAYSSVDKYDKDKLKFLMLWNEKRGLDSCGFYSRNNNGDNELVKSNCSYTDEIIKNEIKDGNIFLGHLRNRSKGKVDNRSSHPYEEENIVGVHNGTLKNSEELAEEYDEDFDDYFTDSHLLISLIKDRGTSVLEKIEGKASVVYIDKETDEMYAFRRNDERPLYRGEINGGMYISSIKDSLEVIGCKNIKEFKTDYLYCIKDGKVINNRSKKIKKDPIKKKKKTPTTHYGRRYGSHYGSGYGNHNSGYESHKDINDNINDHRLNMYKDKWKKVLEFEKDNFIEASWGSLVNSGISSIFGINNIEKYLESCKSRQEVSKNKYSYELLEFKDNSRAFIVSKLENVLFFGDNNDLDVMLVSLEYCELRDTWFEVVHLKNGGYIELNLCKDPVESRSENPIDLLNRMSHISYIDKSSFTEESLEGKGPLKVIYGKVDTISNVDSIGLPRFVHPKDGSENLILRTDHFKEDLAPTEKGSQIKEEEKKEDKDKKDESKDILSFYRDKTEEGIGLIKEEEDVEYTNDKDDLIFRIYNTFLNMHQELNCDGILDMQLVRENAEILREDLDVLYREHSGIKESES